jgi:hypothetical protein
MVRVGIVIQHFAASSLRQVNAFMTSSASKCDKERQLKIGGECIIH